MVGRREGESPKAGTTLPPPCPPPLLRWAGMQEIVETYLLPLRSRRTGGGGMGSWEVINFVNNELWRSWPHFQIRDATVAVKWLRFWQPHLYLMARVRVPYCLFGT